MSRFLIAATATSLALAVLAPAGRGGQPDPDWSYVPDAVVLSTGPQFSGNPIGTYTVNVQDEFGPLDGSYVEVEFSPEADALIAWCQGQEHPLLSGFTDANGNVTFRFFGGGCVLPGAFTGPGFIAQVRADEFVLENVYVVSPDAVLSNGQLTTDAGGACDATTANGVPCAEVGLSDAVVHAGPTKLGTYSPCSKVTPPFSAPVGILDGTYLTPYIKAGRYCLCQ